MRHIGGGLEVDQLRFLDERVDDVDLAPVGDLRLQEVVDLPASRLRARLRADRLAARRRSEEHTSELQSRLHLVCRLLLEKKKNRYGNVCPLASRYCCT